MAQIILPYKYEPRDYQLGILRAIDNNKKRLIQIWHRRTGKDKTDVNILAKKMLEKVGTYHYVFPTYTQGKKIIWDGMDKTGFPFLGHFPRELLDGKPNDTEMKLQYKNGSIMQIIGSDRIDMVVGTNPIGIIFSEYSLQNPKAWDYYRPILAENGGWAIFNFTPRGKNHAYDLYNAAKGDNYWWTQILTADDTKIIPQDVLDRERKEIIMKNGDDALFYQEYYCSFNVSVIGSYYYAQIKRANDQDRITNVPYDSTKKVYTVWDLGIDDAMAIGYYQRDGGMIRMIDYTEVTGLGLPQVWKLVKEKPYIYDRHFAPHDIKQRELGTGLSRIEVAESLGINFEVVPSLPVIDGIDAGRRMFDHLLVDKSNCKEWLRAIEQYTKEYDEDRKMYKNSPHHDWTSHAADMHRYASIIEDQMSDEAKITTTQCDSYYNQEDFNPYQI